MASADVLLHPVRLRILRAFLGDRALTVSQLGDEISDVSAASLYRHVAVLTKAGVLHVVAERRVRAVVERTYMLRPQAAQIQPDEAAAMTPEQHLGAFMAYAAGMIGDAERYLMTGNPDPVRDGASYRMAALWLSDAEFAELARDLSHVLQPRLAIPPAPNRRRRVLYTTVLPAAEVPARAQRATRSTTAGRARPQKKGPATKKP